MPWRTGCNATLPMLAATLSFLIGLSLGLLGGGGSILTLPILVYVLDVEPRTAIPMSLLVVGITSTSGALIHARGGRVRYRTGLVFGATAMAGAYAGGQVAHFLPASVLLTTFAAVMLVTSAAMMRGRRAPRPAGVPAEPEVAKVLAIGAVVGTVAGSIGAGGGFLIVPALALFGGLAMPEAVGTSLMVIAMQSFAGFAGHAAHVHLDARLTVVVSASAVAGSLAGTQLGRGLSPDHLRCGFAWFVLAMALFLLTKQLPAAVPAFVMVHLAGITGAFVAAVTLALSTRHLGRSASTGGRS